MNVASWLRQHGLDQYIDAFVDNHIDETTLRLLTADDLKEIGVRSLGHRKRLLAAIAALNAPSAAPARPAVREAGETFGEQREVTILFADLSEFTKLSANLGAEATHHLLNRYFDAIDGIIASYGGTVDKHIGDAVMAVFGAPVAHSNDPERAVRAALDMRAAVAELGRQFGLGLQIHAGIANGQVVASGTGSDTHREYTVTGGSVNLAARLQDLAHADEVLISDRVHRSLPAQLECAPRGEVAIRGLEQPVTVWEVRGITQRSSKPVPPSLVGRRGELRQVANMLQASREGGSGQVIYLRGEAGIGKSRLALEFATLAAAAGFTCHRARVLDFGVGKSRGALRVLLRSLLGLAPGAERAARLAAAETALREGLIQPGHRPYLSDLLDLPLPSELRALYDAMDENGRRRHKQAVVSDLVRAQSARRPRLLIVEDVHWADAITLGYLATIAAAIRERPALLIMTSRLADDPLDAGWRSAIQGTPLVTMDLGPLNKGEAMAMASAFIDAGDPFALECILRADGNPLFLEQLLRNRGESGAVGELPATIQSLILARVDHLQPADKRALQAAAVIGQSFSLAALRHLLDQPDYDCRPLIDHYLIRQEGDDLLFAHALIREGVYASLLTARRKALHLQAAKWFAERDQTLRAAHLACAEDPAAAQAFLQAAHVEAAAFRDEPALSLVERGLAVARERADRFALIALQGRLLLDLGRVHDSVAAYRAALALADTDQQRCDMLIGIAGGLRVLDQAQDALATLDQAEALAVRHYLVIQLARLHYLRGSVYWPLGQIEECYEEHQMALDYARQAGSAELEAQALSGLADATSLRARIATAHNHYHHAIVIARTHGFGRIEVANTHMRGIMRYYQNDLRGAALDCLVGAEGAGRVAHHRAEMVARAANGYVLTELGRLDEAREHCDLALALAERLGAQRFVAASQRHIGRVLAAQGHRDEALRWLLASYETAREAGSLAFSGPWALGGIAAVTDDPAQRAWALAEGEALLGGPFHNTFWFYRDAMEACLQSAALDELERYAQALAAFTRAEPVPWTQFFITRARALAACARGMRDAGLLEQLQRVRAEARRAGFALALPAIEAALAEVEGSISVA